MVSTVRWETFRLLSCIRLQTSCPDHEYRYTDVFPSFSKDGTLLVTNKNVDSSIVTMNADGANKHLVFQSATHCKANPLGPCGAMHRVGLRMANGSLSVLAGNYRRVGLPSRRS